MNGSVRTSVSPPPLTSLPRIAEQVASSSRAAVFGFDGTRLLRAGGPPERPFVISVEPAGARWFVQGWGCSGAEARRTVRKLFSLEDPLAEFYRKVRAEPILRGTERAFRGLRLARDASVYEALVHGIVGQQLSVASARALQRRLIDRYGVRLLAGRIEVPVVPSPEALARAGVSGLRSLGLSLSKATALLGVASWSRGGSDGAQLGKGPLETARARLERLHGVGPWTAENALLRGAGRRDVFVAGDLGIRVALERFGRIPRSAPVARARAWADAQYPQWGSYATLYLWRRLAAERTLVAAG